MQGMFWSLISVAYGQQDRYDAWNFPSLWTFFARCHGQGATTEYRFKIGDFAPTRASWPKIKGRMARTHQPFFFLKKLG